MFSFICKLLGHGPARVYLDLAESIVPTSGTGFMYCGSELQMKLGLPSRADSIRDDLYLFIHWGHIPDWPRWGRITLSNCQYSEKKPWYIDGHSSQGDFVTRGGMVRTLARSLEIIDQELVDRGLKKKLLTDNSEVSS